MYFIERLQESKIDYILRDGEQVAKSLQRHSWLILSGEVIGILD